MANAIYPKYKEAILQASANSSLTGTVKVALLARQMQDDEEVELLLLA
jgi:hypothetical protein